MGSRISRRDFLKLGSLGFSLLPLGRLTHLSRWFLPQGGEAGAPVARVAATAIYLYSEPDSSSERLGILHRDNIVSIEEELQVTGQWTTQRWYRLWRGFISSAYLQRVDGFRFHRPAGHIPQGGQLGEISVPYTQSLRRMRSGEWTRLYRLYYESVYWITGVGEGPNGLPWYEITDDRLHIQYWVPAYHVRLIEPEELSPISPEVPVGDKRIEIDIQTQTLTAFEGDHVALQTKVSTGVPSRGPSPNGIPTDTPVGHFHIEVKTPSRHMGDGNLTDDLEAYELPGVPWVSFFHIDGIALHGTYWHDNFGHKMSHGCVNMRNADAKWVYRWSQPTAAHDEWNCKGHGTYIKII